MKPTEIIYTCPFCLDIKGTPDRKGKLYANKRKNLFHCFRCGTSGRATELPPGLEPRGWSYVSTPDDVRLYGFEAPLLFELEGVMRDAAVRHLLGRGLELQDIVRYGIRYSAVEGRLWFPIYTIPGGEPAWYLGHNIDGGYWMPPGNKMANHTVFRTFGIPIMDEREPFVVVTEGIFDAISVARVSAAVATFGYTPPRSRLECIPFLAKHAIVMYDSDADQAAINTTLRLMQLDIGVVKAPQELFDTDPGDASEELIRRIIVESLKIADWSIT